MTAGHDSAGFTLVELVVVIGLTMIIALVVVPPFLEANKIHSRASTRATLLAEGRIGLERLLRELRAITVTSGVPDISLADDDSITFGSLSYRVSSGMLERSQDTGTTWQAACGNVSSLALTYGDETGTALSSTPLSSGDQDLVRRIGVVLALASGSETLTLRSGVHIRQFGYQAP